MPFGDPQGNFAGTGGYGGQFPGFGGAGLGYTGGYGNPSSVGGGTAGQTSAGRAYANTLNKHNPMLANYSGTTRSVSGPSGSGGIRLGSKKKNVTPAQQAEIQAKIKANKAAAEAYEAGTYVDPSTGIESTEQQEIPNPLDHLLGLQHPPGGYTGGYGKTTSQIPGVPGSGGPRVSEGGYGTFYGHDTGALKDRSRLGGWQTNPNRRQFGGPVAPGGQYTVGENGPETLQMGPGGGGQVIPNNPADAAAGGFPGGGGMPQPASAFPQPQMPVKPIGPTPSNNQPLGGMNPQLIQQMFQLMQQNPQMMQNIRQRMQQGGGMQRPSGQMPPAGLPAHGLAPPTRVGGGGMQRSPPPTGLPTHGLTPPSSPGGGGMQRPPSMGFGGSGLGQSGVLGQLRDRLGGGGSMYRG